MEPDISRLENLPDEVLLRVLLKTPYNDVMSICKLSKTLNDFCKRQHVLKLYADQGFIQVSNSNDPTNFKRINFPHGRVKKFKVTLIGIFILSIDGQLHLFANGTFTFFFNNIIDFDCSSIDLFAILSIAVLSFNFLSKKVNVEQIYKDYTPLSQIVCGDTFQMVMAAGENVLVRGTLFEEPGGNIVFEEEDKFRVFDVPCSKIYASNDLACFIDQKGQVYMYGYINMGNVFVSFPFEDGKPFGIRGKSMFVENISISYNSIILYVGIRPQNYNLEGFAFDETNFNVFIFSTGYIKPDGTAFRNGNENLRISPLKFETTRIRHFELSETNNFIVDKNGTLEIFALGSERKPIKLQAKVTMCQIFESQNYILCNVHMPYIASCIMCSIDAKFECGNQCETYYCGKKCALEHWNNSHIVECSKK